MDILLVEDDKKLSLALGMRLKAYGHKLTFSPDAVSAVSQAISAQPDLIIIDINLPGGDGFKVAERLKSNVETSSTPFVFITASRQQGLRDRAVQLGASGFLEKPFDSTQLLEVIDSTTGY